MNDDKKIDEEKRKLFPELSDSIHELMLCKCEDKYSIEPHGNGHYIFWGRCEHRQGTRLGLLTECKRQDLIDHFEKALNGELDEN